MTEHGLDPELLAQLGLKKASELDTPEDEPAELPWTAPLGSPSGASASQEGRKPRIRDLTERNRAVADAEAEEKKLAGEHRQRRVQRSKPLPKTPKKKPGKKPDQGGSKLVGARTSPPQEPIPDWADSGAAPDWATDGELPARVAQLISTWEDHLAQDDQDDLDRAAAERIAAGEEVGPQAETTPKELDPLTDEEALHLARAVGLRLLNAQPRTRHELRTKMAERDVPLSAIEQALDEFEKYRYLDDAAFARAWVESRVRSKGFARGRLSQELRRKGVDAELIEAALDQIDAEDEKERCEQLALKKLGTRTLPPLGPSQEDRKERDKVLRRVVGFLARKGFNQGMALSCARRAMDRHDQGERSY